MACPREVVLLHEVLGEHAHDVRALREELGELHDADLHEGVLGFGLDARGLHQEHTDEVLLSTRAWSRMNHPNWRGHGPW